MQFEDLTGFKKRLQAKITPYSIGFVMVHNPLQLKSHQHYNGWRKETDNMTPKPFFSQSVVVLSLQPILNRYNIR
jgi:hypothetical protein